MEPPIGYGIGVSFHLPGVPFQNDHRVGFQPVGVMGLYEKWVLPACSTWRCATTSSIPIAEARSLRLGVWFSKSASVPG
jgi:hypothetical protein